MHRELSAIGKILFFYSTGFLLKNRSLFLGLTVLRGKDKADSGKEKKITRRKGENPCRRKP
jgi:hypothetical protein